MNLDHFENLLKILENRKMYGRFYKNGKIILNRRGVKLHKILERIYQKFGNISKILENLGGNFETQKILEMSRK
jgi:hypothetical protein